jgi:hypothetical protein
MKATQLRSLHISSRRASKFVADCVVIRERSPICGSVRSDVGQFGFGLGSQLRYAIARLFGFWCRFNRTLFEGVHFLKTHESNSKIPTRNWRRLFGQPCLEKSGVIVAVIKLGEVLKELPCRVDCPGFLYICGIRAFVSPWRTCGDRQRLGSFRAIASWRSPLPSVGQSPRY